MFNINQVATKVNAEWFDADHNSYSKSFTIKTSATAEQVSEQLGRWIEKSRPEIEYLGEPVSMFFEYKGKRYHDQGCDNSILWELTNN
jgi:hypothetical protein